MKTRVLFGVLGFVFVLLALYVFPPIILEVLVAALCVLATYEAVGATKLIRNRLLLLVCGVVSLLLAAGHSTLMPLPLFGIVQGLVMMLLALSFLILLRFHDGMNCSEVAYAFFGALLVPYLMLSLLRIFQMEGGPLLVLLPLLAAWISDTCALFTGLFFGKRKLAPVVSPKKTVEGAIGGVVGATIVVVLAAVLLNVLADLNLPLWAAVVLGAGGSVLGVVGDLSFSIIKRQTGIKDYGSIFPGHGGVLDRFDSVLFVAPLAEIIFRIVW